MKNSYKPNWFDFFMLFCAVFPFLVMAYGQSLAQYFGIPLFVWGVIWYLITACCLGFPAATILYFIWRFNGNKTKSAT